MTCAATRVKEITRQKNFVGYPHPPKTFSQKILHVNFFRHKNLLLNFFDTKIYYAIFDTIFFHYSIPRRHIEQRTNDPVQSNSPKRS